jgi:5-oxoprolinase (ATP-hydrolysing)
MTAEDRAKDSRAKDPRAKGSDTGDDTGSGVGVPEGGGLHPVDAVALELFASRFTALAREMGERLRRTAVSTNVKERLDFSCAVLDPRGDLVVNAPHIPVHLGALGLCVREVARALELGPGDVALTNHPAFGGSHLPDVTVVTPVFESSDDGESDESAALLGYVASRAHHAEIGGRRPGSMPPEARCLAEEGVVIAPRKLVCRGEPRWEEVRRLLEQAPWPSRAVAENLADLAAALAASHRGATGLRELARKHGRATVDRYMRSLEELAERRLSAALERFGDGIYRAEETLDDGTPLAVEITIGGAVGRGRARLDFTGTGAVHPGNLNAPPAVGRSSVLYVLRLLLDEPLPLNEGLLAPVEIHFPEGTLLNPGFPDDPERAPAVVGGNVETSQRLVGLLLKALRLAASSQGTMNNVLFGNERFGYYETVCGGAGAGPGFHGADAVHTHMTNTRITDPEVLEHRYPVRLESFRIRRGSGGAGRFHGGDGAVREITFLEPASLSVVSQHRTRGPFGLEGGEPGAPGSQRVIRASGEEVELGSVDGCEVEAGDRLVLETPGGGGWGEAGVREADEKEAEE